MNVIFLTFYMKEILEEKMAKRILNMTPTELINLTKQDVISAIAGSEGRVLASETIGITIPLLTDVTNAEFAASMGADMILLNMFDVQKPKIYALPEVEKEETVREVKRLTGRLVGINLEPVEENVKIAILAFTYTSATTTTRSVPISSTTTLEALLLWYTTRTASLLCARMPSTPLLKLLSAAMTLPFTSICSLATTSL